MKTRIFFSFCMTMLASQLSVALPAVVDANTAWTADSSQPQRQGEVSAQQASFAISQDQSLDTTQRLVIVEQSINNINQMDLPGQIQRLQQDVQELRGKVDELQRQLSAKQATSAPSSSASAPTPVPAATVASDLSLAVDKEVVAPAAVNPNLPPQEQAQRTYDAAFSLVRSGSYADAISAFNSFIQIYGDDNEYSVSAYYWLGELYAYQHDYSKANDALNRVVAQYPKSNKVPDAMLKLGIVNQKLGDQAKANDWFMQVIKQYPDSNAARMAKTYVK
jgi:tol-pal system protein YbgF